MELHFKGQAYTGYRDVIPAGEGLMSLGLLKLTDQEEYAGESGHYEIALVILSGKATIQVDDHEFKDLGERADVFSGRAATVYIPRDSKYRVKAKGENFEAALCLVQAEEKHQAFVVKPEEVVVNQRGGQTWKREVHDIIVDNGEETVNRIVVGETFSAPGNWSSFPSHKHDVNVPGQETELMEIYHFRVSPQSGFGIQVLYTEDRELDEAYLIRDTDSVFIPKGYHPVVAPPSVKVYYLWFLAGKTGRTMLPNDDPNFKELRKLETL